MKFSLKHIVVFALGSLTLSVIGCQDQPEPLPIRSLVASGDVTYLCLSPDRQGVAIEDCPDFEDRENHLFALVTQTLTAEVAVIDVTRGAVIDTDRSTPGFTFLRVGSKPVDIVSTPGGQVSFVGVAGVGHEGIFALPTSCLGPPREISEGVYETPRDLTTWPACSLPAAPGAMAILIDPVDEDGRFRLSCDSDERVDEQPEPQAALRSECPVDLRREVRDPGRRKLAVALPELGEIAIIDAQRLVDEHEPGTFDACPIERTYALDVDLPDTPIPQRIPEDLASPGCIPFSVEYPPPIGEFRPMPAGMDYSEGSLFVADRGAPVIHELDVKDPCNVKEREPLLPLSLEEPTRVVTTTRVAASPTLTDGTRYLYAIDEFGRSTANVMAFDLTPGHAERTPIVREGTPFLPFEPSDRITFSAPAQDIVFAHRDLPISDDVVGEAVVGERCDPDPSLDPDAPGAQYRSHSDASEGASPSNLRGTFGFVLLTNGQVGVIDVEDYDEPCRRPIYKNSADILDFRGCANDPEEPTYYTLPDGEDETGQPTVTDEVSCRIVQQHRARSARLVQTSGSNGAGAPSLRGFPRLTFEERGLPTNASEESLQYPKMLAVDFPDPAHPGETIPAGTYVGTTLYRTDDVDNPLDTDPATAERASVVLPWIEPRAYPSSEQVVATYEGRIGGERPSGFLKVGENETDPTLDIVEDNNARFCNAGIQGENLMAQVGEERFGLSGKKLDDFARRHADYVQLTQDILPSDDEYWRSDLGQSCGDGEGYFACELVFGHVDEDRQEDLLPARELRIVAAFQDHLVVEPRGSGSIDEKQRFMELMDCCFPSGVSYTVRASEQWIVQGSASGFRHKVVPTRVDTDAGPIFPCGFDCNPAKKYFDGRVFEVSKDNTAGCNTVPVNPAQPGSECIYNTLTARFVIYSGSEPSQRDMTFSYDLTGGFSPLTISLTRNDTSIILPQALTTVPGYNLLSVVDAQDRGLMLLSLDTLTVASPSPFF